MILPRLAFAYSMKLITDIADDEFGTVIRLGKEQTRVIGAKSAIASKPSDG